MKSAETRGNSLTTLSPVGLFRTDREGTCLEVNARWCEITGLASLEPLGEGWTGALHRDDRERVLREWGEAMREARGFESEFRFRRPDGAATHVLAQAFPERDASGRINGFVGAIIDLSQQLEVQKELRNLASQLALAQERERARIAAGLHDEVGQLLAVARAKLGQLVERGAQGDLPGQAGEIRALIDRAIQETRALTFDLSSPVLYEFGLAAAIESLCELLAKESGVRFHVETDGKPDPLGEDLRILLYRAVSELCRNVVTHARALNAEVHVHSDGDRIQIVVADDGDGFDVADSAPRFGPEGGFGLFDIRVMCAHVGARFEIESAVGKGARAVLSVPLG